MKRCSMLLVIRETQIKTTMRYHLTHVRVVIINKSTNKCWWGYGKRETLLHCWWECKLVQPLWKAIWRHLKKLKMDLPFDPAIPYLGIYLKEPKIQIQNNVNTLIFIAGLLTIVKIWKQPKWPSINEWIKHLWDLYTMEYYSATNKEENFTLCDSMGGPGEHYANKITLSEKDKYYMTSLICGI